MANEDIIIGVGIKGNDAQILAEATRIRKLVDAQNPTLRLNKIDTSLLNRGLADSKKQFNQLTEASVDFGDSVERGLRRVVALGAASIALGGIIKAFQATLQASRDLERSLTDVNVVLNLPTDQIKAFGDSLFDIARTTKQSFDSVAKSATEFARQGLNVEDTLKRTQSALLLVNLAGLDAGRATETITAAINSFSKENLKAIDIVNKLVAVDQNFAVSAADLAEAITRVGSTSQEVGVDFNKLISLITATQQVSQRGGAVIGNAFKTIFQRLQREDTINALEDLGIQVREVDKATGDYTGNLIAADRVLQQIGERFKNTTQEQKAQISQLVAGVNQGNIFRAALQGLTIQQEAYNTAAKATDEAVRRNAQLLTTQDAKIKSFSLTLQQAAANFGKVGFGDRIDNLFEGLNNQDSNNIGANLVGSVLKAFTGKGEDVGSQFAQVFIKGFSDVITGTGLPILGIIGVKIADTIKTFATNTVRQINPFGNPDIDSQRQIQSFLVKQRAEIAAINSSTDDKIVKERLILDLFKKQTIALAEQRALRSSVASILEANGPSIIAEAAARKPVKNLAGGFADAVSREKTAISHGVGGARGSAKPVFIRDFNGKPAVANTDEYIVPNYAGSGKSAIFNRKMVNELGLPDNAIKVGSGLSNYAGSSVPASLLAKLKGLSLPENPHLITEKILFPSKPNFIPRLVAPKPKTPFSPKFASILDELVESPTPAAPINPVTAPISQVIKHTSAPIGKLAESGSFTSEELERLLDLGHLAKGHVPNFAGGRGIRDLFSSFFGKLEKGSQLISGEPFSPVVRVVDNALKLEVAPGVFKEPSANFKNFQKGFFDPNLIVSLAKKFEADNHYVSEDRLMRLLTPGAKIFDHSSGYTPNYAAGFLKIHEGKLKVQHPNGSFADPSNQFLSKISQTVDRDTLHLVVKRLNEDGVVHTEESLTKLLTHHYSNGYVPNFANSDRISLTGPGIFQVRGAGAGQGKGISADLKAAINSVGQEKAIEVFKSLTPPVTEIAFRGALLRESLRKTNESILNPPNPSTVPSSPPVRQSAPIITGLPTREEIEQKLFNGGSTVPSSAPVRAAPTVVTGLPTREQLENRLFNGGSTLQFKTPNPSVSIPTSVSGLPTREQLEQRLFSGGSTLDLKGPSPAITPLSIGGLPTAESLQQHFRNKFLDSPEGREQAGNNLKAQIDQQIVTSSKKFGEDVVAADKTFQNLVTAGDQLVASFKDGKISTKEFAAQSENLSVAFRDANVKLGTFGKQTNFKELINSRGLSKADVAKLQGIAHLSTNDAIASTTFADVSERARGSTEFRGKIADLEDEIEQSNQGGFFSRLNQAPNRALKRAQIAGLRRGIGAGFGKIPRINPGTLAKIGGIGQNAAFFAPFVTEAIAQPFINNIQEATPGDTQISRERAARGVGTFSSSLSTAGFIATLAPLAGPASPVVLLAAGLVAARGALKGFQEATEDSKEDIQKRFGNQVNESEQRVQTIQTARAGLFRIAELKQQNASPEDIRSAREEALNSTRTITDAGIRKKLQEQILSGDTGDDALKSINKLVAKAIEKEQNQLLSSSGNFSQVNNKILGGLERTNISSNIFAALDLTRKGRITTAEGLGVEEIEPLIQANAARFKNIENPEKQKKALDAAIATQKSIEGLSKKAPEAFFATDRTRSLAKGAGTAGIFASALTLGALAPATFAALNAEKQLGEINLAKRKPLIDTLETALGDKAKGGEVKKQLDAFKNVAATQDELDKAYQFLITQVDAEADAARRVIDEKNKLDKAQEEDRKSIDLGKRLLDTRTASVQKFLQEQGGTNINLARASSEADTRLAIQRAGGAFGETSLQLNAIQTQRELFPEQQKAKEANEAQGFVADITQEVVKNRDKLKEAFGSPEKLDEFVKKLGEIRNLKGASDALQELQDKVANKEGFKAVGDAASDLRVKLTNTTIGFKNAGDAAVDAFKNSEKAVRALAAATPSAHTLEATIANQQKSSFLNGNIPFTKTEGLTAAEQKATGLKETIEAIRAAGGTPSDELVAKQKEAQQNLLSKDIDRRIEVLQNATPSSDADINLARREALKALQNQKEVGNSQSDISKLREFLTNTGFTAKGINANSTDEELFKVISDFRKTQTESALKGGLGEGGNVSVKVGDVFNDLLDKIRASAGNAGGNSAIDFYGGDLDKANEALDKVYDKVGNATGELIDSFSGNMDNLINHLDDVSGSFKRVFDGGIQLSVGDQTLPVNGTIQLQLDSSQLDSLAANILKQVQDMVGPLQVQQQQISLNVDGLNKKTNFVPKPAAPTPDTTNQ